MKHQLTWQGPRKRSVELLVSFPETFTTVVLLTNGTGQDFYSDDIRLLAEALEHQRFGTCLFNVLPDQSDEQPLVRTELGQLFGPMSRFLKTAPGLPATVSRTNFCVLGLGDGAAAALHAASLTPADFAALAICGGRPAAALTVASKNTLPTLFLLGSKDAIASDACRAAYKAARGPKELQTIVGAGHLLREPGTLEEAAERCARWFHRYTPTPSLPE